MHVLLESNLECAKGLLLKLFLNQGCTLIDRIRVMSVYIQQYFCYIVVIVSFIGEANRSTQTFSKSCTVINFIIKFVSHTSPDKFTILAVAVIDTH